ncbi:ectonucleotide pyrophosphatase/phosphodiesterase [Chryseolinea sp. T2]|uniref:alkaline phosphatase family protein n=1 Tax=Chryseolinea sp. T2 TaxID=3129255 RepID=UPI003078890B
MKAAFLFLTLSCFFQVALAQDGPHVLLISFDGFRHDYVERYDAKNFKEFIRKGSSAKGLIPSFPSKTFPNHYSIVTGLYPGNHGLVDNNFYDPKTDEHYTSKNKKAVADSIYYGGTPIWKLAHNNGLKSASFFWIGSEVKNSQPDYFFPYNEKIPDKDRVQQVLSWLALPAAERPRFISLYFSVTDDAGHQYGPDSKEIRNAVLHADSLLGLVMRGISRVQVPVNVMVVSDHGMKGIKQEDSSYLLLSEILSEKEEGTIVVNSGSHVHIYQSDDQKRKALFDRLNKDSKNFRVLLKEQYPERWHYRTERAGDMLLVADAGYYFLDMERSSLAGFLKPWGWAGVHGYDPRDTPEMNGIFYANGPNIRQGYTLDAFENIHIYPFIARILNLPLPHIDGKASVLSKIYQARNRTRASAK